MFIFTNENPDFWVQLKGQNAGKPIRESIPNSIGIKTDPEVLNSAYLYYTILYLFNSGHFGLMLKGSVIPYIRHRDITRVLIDFWSNNSKLSK